MKPYGRTRRESSPTVGRMTCRRSNVTFTELSARFKVRSVASAHAFTDPSFPPFCSSYCINYTVINSSSVRIPARISPSARARTTARARRSRVRSSIAGSSPCSTGSRTCGSRPPTRRRAPSRAHPAEPARALDRVRPAHALSRRPPTIIARSGAATSSLEYPVRRLTWQTDRTGRLQSRARNRGQRESRRSPCRSPAGESCRSTASLAYKLRLSQLYESLGRFDEAIGTYREAIALMGELG
jgi:hypothetical protein